MTAFALYQSAACCAAGVMLGAAYFGSLWWNARMFAGGGQLRVAASLMVGRFVMLGVALTLASLQSGQALLSLALGVFVARAAALHGVTRAAP